MITIQLHPTPRIENLNGIPFRVWSGQSSNGAEVEMLGLFRIRDPIKRGEFEAAVCAVRVDDPKPVQLLGEHGLIRP